jgi:hypothetical protein
MPVSLYTPRMSACLFVAAGGGGDAIAAVMVARMLGVGERRLHVATFSWDRLMVDPVPGPRGRDWFTGLRPVGGHNFQVTPGSAVRAPAGSLLPHLAAELPATLYLLDASKGAEGLSAQLQELAVVLRAARVLIVDGGGDILATGREPGLRSPLADSLVLAAASGLGREVQVLVAGPGLDGELPEDVLLERCSRLGGTMAGRLSAEEARDYQPLFGWHPSEATGLLCAAALGARGWVEIRGAGLAVRLTDHSSEIYRLEHPAVMTTNQVAQAVMGTRSLAEAEEATTAAAGLSEIEEERHKAAGMVPGSGHPVLDLPAIMDRLYRHAARAANRGIDYLTLRRIGEVLGLTADELPRLGDQLRQGRSLPYFPPLWPVGEEQRPRAAELPSAAASRRAKGSG